MAFLFVGLLAGAALYASITLSSLRPYGTALAGGAVLIFAVTIIVTLPAGQTLGLGAPLFLEAATPAKAAIGWIAGIAAAGAGALGWALRATFYPPPAPPLAANIAPPDPFAAAKRAEARMRVLRDGGMLALCLLLALAGAALGQISVPRALLIGLCAGISVIAAIDLREALPRDPLLMRSNWGGLGSGLGGWELSRSAVLLGVVLAFAGAALTAAVVAPVPPPSGAPPGKANAGVSPPPANTPAAPPQSGIPAPPPPAGHLAAPPSAASPRPEPAANQPPAKQ
jgi:hypothetical protein